MNSNRNTVARIFIGGTKVLRYYFKMAEHVKYINDHRCFHSNTLAFIKNQRHLFVLQNILLL